jgi:hypothetical protein
MIDLPPNTDPVYHAPASLSRLDRFFLKLINDKRDLPFIYLTLKVCYTMLPFAVLLYLPFVNSWLWLASAAIYLYLNNVTYKGPFGLMMHCSSHRPLYKKKIFSTEPFDPLGAGTVLRAIAGDLLRAPCGHAPRGKQHGG